MGNLAHLTGGMDNVKKRLDQANHIGTDLSDILGNRFKEVNSNLEKNLKTLVEQASNMQNSAFSGVVEKAVLNITQSQQLMLNSNMGVLQELLKLKAELSEEVSEVRTGVGSSSESLSEKIKELEKGISQLPTSFP